MSKKLHFWVFLPFILSLLLTLVIFIALKSLPDKLPLFYSLPWGDSQLATRQQFLIIPASISIITLVNLIIAWQLHPSQTFFKKTLQISSIIISIIIIISFIKTILNFV